MLFLCTLKNCLVSGNISLTLDLLIPISNYHVLYIRHTHYITFIISSIVINHITIYANNIIDVSCIFELVPHCYVIHIIASNICQTDNHFN